MTISEAFLIRKIPYGDADYIISLFTRDLGKINGLAKNAKKSAKRFGGCIEPLVHFQVSLRDKHKGFYFIENTETIGVFKKFIEDIELFTWGSFLLDNIDALTENGLPNEELFNLLLETINELNNEKSILAAVLRFQLKALSISGYEPNLDTCAECENEINGDSFFNLRKGGAICLSCRKLKKNSFLVSKEFLRDKELMKTHPKKALQYIRLFAKFTEYHTEKKLKSSRFIKEIEV